MLEDVQRCRGDLASYVAFRKDKVTRKLRFVWCLGPRGVGSYQRLVNREYDFIHKMKGWYVGLSDLGLRTVGPPLKSLLIPLMMVDWGSTWDLPPPESSTAKTLKSYS